MCSTSNCLSVDAELTTLSNIVVIGTTSNAVQSLPVDYHTFDAATVHNCIYSGASNTSSPSTTMASISSTSEGRLLDYQTMLTKDIKANNRTFPAVSLQVLNSSSCTRKRPYLMQTEETLESKQTISDTDVVMLDVKTARRRVPKLKKKNGCDFTAHQPQQIINISNAVSIPSAAFTSMADTGIYPSVSQEVCDLSIHQFPQFSHNCSDAVLLAVYAVEPNVNVTVDPLANSLPRVKHVHYSDSGVTLGNSSTAAVSDYSQVLSTILDPSTDIRKSINCISDINYLLQLLVLLLQLQIIVVALQGSM